jgi:hypothetical protein
MQILLKHVPPCSIAQDEKLLMFLKRDINWEIKLSDFLKYYRGSNADRCDAMNWVCAFIRKIKMKKDAEILEISKVLTIKKAYRKSTRASSWTKKILRQITAEEKFKVAAEAYEF